MTTRVRSHSRVLRMPLLALTLSAAIVGGVFVAAQPAHSVDGVGGGAAQCLTAADQGASVVVPSIVPVGSPLHIEGAGWGASSETTRGFIIVTLDDGQEMRPDDVVLPSWTPAAVARNKAAWNVAEVGLDGSFRADVTLPAAWAVGSAHTVAVGDGVTGTYVEVSVIVAQADAQVRPCVLTPAEEPAGEPGVTVPTELPPADVGDPDVEPSVDAAIDGFGDDAATNMSEQGADRRAVSPSAPTPSVNGQPAASASASSTPSAAASPTPSSPNGNSSSSSGGANAGQGNADAPTPSPSSAQESVSASQIGPKAHSEQQATNQAVREQESRLNGWFLAGGGLLGLIGAVTTVSIVRRSHGMMR